MSGSKFGAVALTVFGLGLAVYAFKPSPSPAQGAAAAGADARYTVIDTEATNLLVVDNAKNTLYFYTVDPDKGPGDDLHLRGTLDLNEVGKPVIKPHVVRRDK